MINPDWANPKIRPAKWLKGTADWVEGDTAYISVVFSWDADEAFSKAVAYKAAGYKVKVGGAGLLKQVIRGIFDGVAEWGKHCPQALAKHNPEATFAVRGCHVKCSFCSVWWPDSEGSKYTYNPHFVPRPILCDNNLSATDPAFQEYICRRYKEAGVLLKDAQSGFEPKTFNDQTYQRWRETLRAGGGGWRFAFDETGEREEVREMLKILKDEPASKKRVYVLVGNEPFEDCMKRIYEVIEWGGEPHVQALVRHTSRQKRPYIKRGYGWDLQSLIDVPRWANRWVWRKCTFDEYRRSYRARPVIDERQEMLMIDERQEGLGA